MKSQRVKEMNEQLLAASQLGHDELVGKLCAKIAKLKLTEDHRSNFGEALVEASGRGHIKTMKVLIQSGTDVNFETKSRGKSGFHGIIWTSPLLEATRGGYTAAVELLLHSGAEINKAHLVESHCDRTTKKHLTALIIASINGHKDIVKLLLSRGAKGINEALPCATEKDHLEIAEAILQHGGDPNCFLQITVSVKVSVKVPVLMIAVQKGHLEILRLLLKWGALVNNPIPDKIDVTKEEFDTILWKIEDIFHRSTQSEEGLLEMTKFLLLNDVDVRNIDRETNITAFTLATRAIECTIYSMREIKNSEILKQCLLLLDAAGANVSIQHLEARFLSVHLCMQSNMNLLRCFIRQILARNSSQISLVESCRNKTH